MEMLKEENGKKVCAIVLDVKSIEDVKSIAAKHKKSQSEIIRLAIRNGLELVDEFLTGAH